MEHTKHEDGAESVPEIDAQVVEDVSDGGLPAEPARRHRTGLGQPITGAPAPAAEEPPEGS